MGRSDDGGGEDEALLPLGDETDPNLLPESTSSALVLATHKTHDFSCAHREDSWETWRLKSFSTVLLMLCTYLQILYHKLESKLLQLEGKVKELSELLDKRTKELCEVLVALRQLQKKSKENERMAELHRYELREQKLLLYELYTLLHTKKEPDLSPYVQLLQSIAAGDELKHIWVFRKHKETFTLISKQHIQLLVKASVNAGIVPEHVTDTTDSSAFYTALQYSICESPDKLKDFLSLMQETLQDSKLCQNLCQKVLHELGT